MTVLLVTVDRAFTTAVATLLRGRGYQVRHVLPGSVAVAAPDPDSWRLVLVEVDESPDRARIRCAGLRSRTEVPIMALARRGREDCGMAALAGGADDYLLRPVTSAELLTRMSAVTRRPRPETGGERGLGRLYIDLSRRRVTVDGQAVRLTRKEFQLLTALTHDPGSVVTRDRLMAEVWRASPVDRRSRTLESHITTLRGKLRPAAVVENIRGVGYRILAAVE